MSYQSYEVLSLTKWLLKILDLQEAPRKQIVKFTKPLFSLK